MESDSDHLASFKFNPKVNELCIVTDYKFYLNADKRIFELDRNPYGEPELIPIMNVTYEEKGSILNFDATYHGEKTIYSLKSEYGCLKIMYKILSTSGSFDFKKDTQDKDKIELIFNNGNLSKIYFYKYVDYQLVDSLAVTSEENKLFLITQNPWEKNMILERYWDNDTLVFKTKSKEHHYKPDVQPFILQTIKEFIR